MGQVFFSKKLDQNVSVQSLIGCVLSWICNVLHATFKGHYLRGAYFLMSLSFLMVEVCDSKWGIVLGKKRQSNSLTDDTGMYYPACLDVNVRMMFIY